MSAPDPAHRDALGVQNAVRGQGELPAGGVPRALREAAELAGLDPMAMLYNEALGYAEEGHHRLARERLQILLCMAPDDGEARLMLARVFVAEQRWSDALAALDEAASCGVAVPVSLRRAVEDHLRAERTGSEDTTGTGGGRRDPSEVRALRLEARRLRSENAQQQAQITRLEREVRKWAWATAGVSALTIAFIVGSLALGARSPGVDASDGPAATAEAATGGVEEPALEPPAPGTGKAVPVPVPVQAPAPEPAPPAAPPPPTPAEVEAEVRAALAEVTPEPLTVRVDGGRVAVTGAVLSHRQRRALERAAASVPGVSRVDVSGVELLVRTRGALHVVRRGDTLTGLAVEYYGNSGLAPRIQEANGVDADALRIGQRLTIPPLAR